ncbi:GNAT family N-acetyltransferase [Thalassotalea ponticola]|uniref:GNAT family N-acetyltransferase n=1 Tax=Thalassotalea ponticola TaxID=1523392 RepID=UPI0025B4F66F|nr:GNAT family N-acetyltransferase [Thalassotalea ponticola]MDN3652221.1 GNAT family N-acetyltransferase [Thalassotalea ponticola]
MLNVTVAIKADKKRVKRFYKQQAYSASFLGDDVCYLLVDATDQIIASVIVSYQHQCPFLHALVVAKPYRNQGIASKLLQHCQQQHRTITCFAKRDLRGFYLRHGFVVCASGHIDNSLSSRYARYVIKQPDLLIFAYG